MFTIIFLCIGIVENSCLVKAFSLPSSLPPNCLFILGNQAKNSLDIDNTLFTSLLFVIYSFYNRPGITFYSTMIQNIQGPILKISRHNIKKRLRYSDYKSFLNL